MRQQPCDRLRISIHAPRTGSDSTICARRRARKNFNPRSPHGERPAHTTSISGLNDFNPRSPHGERHVSLQPSGNPHLFQSTLPARGATTTVPEFDFAIAISIHAPRTGSDPTLAVFLETIGTISIHAPRTGSDGLPRDYQFREDAFQSTLPARGATVEANCKGDNTLISIHAPRTGSDLRCADTGRTNAYFNPRSPHGERRKCRRLSATKTTFQSTLPARGATTYKCPDCGATIISIHAPRTGSDAIGGRGSNRNASFQSTLPARGATFKRF